MLEEIRPYLKFEELFAEYKYRNGRFCILKLPSASVYVL